MTRQEAIDLYFEGDEALYADYVAACQSQFGADVEAGDAAVSRSDHLAVRRLAHALKSVLCTLGRSQHAEWASALENAALTQDVCAIQAAWHPLRAALLQSFDA